MPNGIICASVSVMLKRFSLLVLIGLMLGSNVGYSSEQCAHREPFFERIPSLQKTLNALFRDYGTVRKRNLKTSQFYTYFEPLEEDDEWKAMLADNIISIGIKFLREHNLISSKAHERLTEEFEDMVNVEIARGTKLKRMERVKGYV